jgi:hypothetical protein
MRPRSSILVAALAAALIACGDDDGGAQPGGPDAQVPAADAAGADLGPVTIQVMWPHVREPAPEVPVVFYDPDGAIRSRTLTDEDGVATASVLPGSAVLAFIRVEIPDEPVRYHLRGVLDLQHGDSIVLRGPEPPPGLERSGEMTFVLPEHPDAENYQVYTSCGDGFNFDTSEVTVRFRPGCNRSPMSVLALVDLGFPDNWDLGYPSILATGIDRADGDSVDITGTWQDATTDPITLTDVPRSVTYAYALATYTRGGDDSLPVPERGEQVSPMTDPMALSLARATAPDATLLDIQLRNGDRGVGEQRVDWWIEGAADGGMTAAMPPLLPWVGRVLYEVDTRTFRWARVGEGPWDTTYVRTSWSGTLDDAAVSGTWIIAARGDLDEVTVPEVPDDLRAWDPEHVVEMLASADLFDSDQIATWDEARQLGHDGLWPERARDLPVPSLVRLSTYQASF